MRKLNINWNVRQYVKMCMNGSITFDNAIQRALVWDQPRKSLLIDSMISGYPVPPFYARRGENKVFDMLDGKQRSNAMCSYLNNEFPLEGVSEEYEGLYFSELPEEVQDEIKSYSLTVYYFEDITEDEISEMFYRLNNGKALTAIELTRVKAKSFDKIRELAAHDIFNDALKESQLNRYTNEDIVIKAIVMLSVEKPSLENKVIRPFIIENEVTDILVSQIYSALTTIKYIHEDLENKGYTKPAKKLYTRTHLISMIPLALDKGYCNDLTEFVRWFYTPKKRGASVSLVYNTHSSAGANSAYAVEMRQRELTEYYKKFINGDTNIL